MMKIGWNPKVWLNQPEQTFARFEWEWTLRWLKSFKGGLGVLILVVLLYVAPWGIGAAMHLFAHLAIGEALSVAVMLSMMLSGLAGLLAMVFTFFLFYRRAWKPLRQGRARDLAMTPAHPESIWPALFIAPVVFATIVAIAAFPLGILSLILGVKNNPLFAMSGMDMDYSVLYGQITSIVGSLILTPFMWSAQMAYMSARGLPKGGFPRLAFLYIVSTIIIAGLPNILGMLLVLVLALVEFPIGEFAIITSGPLYRLVFGFLLPLLFSIALFRISLGMLKGKSWRRFREYAANQ